MLLFYFADMFRYLNLFSFSCFSGDFARIWMECDLV